MKTSGIREKFKFQADDTKWATHVEPVVVALVSATAKLALYLVEHRFDGDTTHVETHEAVEQRLPTLKHTSCNIVVYDVHFVISSHDSNCGSFAEKYQHRFYVVYF